jgi:hypothetical protein
MVRQLHKPLTLRKENLQLRLEELRKQQEQSSANVITENKSSAISQSKDTSSPAPA